jgi:hypothetical protein
MLATTTVRVLFQPTHPQGEDGEVRWVLFMLGFYVTGAMGVIGLLLSLAWLAHIAVYLIPPYPLHPMLNELFVVLDGAFSLLGVAAFAGFCLYLMGEWMGVVLRVLCVQHKPDVYKLDVYKLDVFAVGHHPHLSHTGGRSSLMCRAVEHTASVGSMTAFTAVTTPDLHHTPHADQGHAPLQRLLRSGGHEGQLHVRPQLCVHQAVPHAAGRHHDELLPGQHRAHPVYGASHHPVLCASIRGVWQPHRHFRHFWQSGGWRGRDLLVADVPSIS